MATYYLDYVNGNDSADGSTFALGGLPTVGPWKTITAGPTAARIAPGDLIKIAKSSDPTSLGVNGTFTNKNRLVTLSGAVTANVDTCDGAWTPSANVTFTQETSDYQRKEGTGCVKLAIADAFSTGKIAYKEISETDFSGYQQISFWFYSQSAIAAGVLKLCLCSDTAGATPVDEFTLPQISSYNQRPIVVNKGSALGASIKSVALYAISDPGTPTVYIDNIFVSKATSADDSLTLYSLIGKNTEGECWYPIKSINGTAVYLDNDPGTYIVNGQGYYRTSETVTCYKRECIDTGYCTSSQHVQEIQDSGTDGNLIDFEGGYNTSSGLQDGQTYFANHAGYGYGLYLDGKTYIKTRRLSFVQYQYGFVMNATSGNNDIGIDSLTGSGYHPIEIYSSNNTITIENINNNDSTGLYLYNGASSNNVNLTNSICNSSSGVHLSSACNYNNLVIDQINYNNGQGLALDYSCSKNNITVTDIKENYYNGVSLYSCDENDIEVTNIIGNNTGVSASYGAISNSGGGNLNKIKNAITSGNTNGVYIANGQLFLQNCDLGETNEVVIYSTAPEWTCVRSHKHDQIGTAFKTFHLMGVIESELTIRHTASGYAWKMTPSSATKKLKLVYENFKAAVNSGSEVTVNVYVRKDSSYNGNAPRLVAVGGVLAGIVNDVTDSLTVGADEWEQLTVQVTPNEIGVLEFYVDCDGTAGNVYVDDFSISQA